MADNLRITTPINNSDHISKAMPKETSAVETINPAKVTSRNNTDQSGQSKSSLNFALDNRSVFQKFVEQLQHTPALSQTLEKLLLGTLPNMKTGTLSNPLQQALAELLAKAPMDEQQMLENLVFQQQHSTKFSGPLFHMLKDMSTGSPPDSDLNAFLGRFLKAYDGFMSAKTTTDNIIMQLKELMAYIPKSYRTGIEEQIAKLQPMNSEQQLQQNLQVLKEKILPLIGRYVSATNDFGESREKIALLVHDISRLNVSSREEVTARFQELVDFCQYELNMPGDTLHQLRMLFVRTMTDKHVVKNEFVESLVQLLMFDSKKELTGTSQTMLRETVNALLLDNSVYMPFTHLFLPVQYQGAFMFAEMWVEKDNSNGKAGEEQHPLKMYLSFDIQNLGSFQIALSVLNNRVSCDFCSPPTLRVQESTMKQDISQIFLANGFTPERVEAISEPTQALTEVLRRVYERRSAVDVTI